jgi:hypothetical protein
MNDPVRRDAWTPGRHWSAGDRPRGRTGPGAQNHCAHGKNLEQTVTEEVLDYKPFDYVTVQQVVGPGQYLVMTNTLTPTADGRGTHLHTTLAGHFAKLPRFLNRQVTRIMLNAAKFPQIYDNLADLLKREAAGQAPAEMAAPAAA